MTEQNPGGWPDAARPGVPANPERDGWHWLRRASDGQIICTKWSAEQGGWVDGVTLSPASVVEFGVTYLGPCLTPAEVSDTLAEIDGLWVALNDMSLRAVAARREGIEAALRVCRAAAMSKIHGSTYHQVVTMLEDDIRVLLEDGR